VEVAHNLDGMLQGVNVAQNTVASAEYRPHTNSA
jgi:hypothetical protein